MSSSYPQFGDRFVTRNFDPEKYVKEITANCIGNAELNVQKSRLESLSEETHSALKRNVFQHYEQFIEAAKDISYLAGEMYQISQTLREQKSLIQNTLDSSIITPKKVHLCATVSPSEVELKTKTNEEETRKKLLSVIEKVEGASDFVEGETRNLVYEGDLLEIDPDSYSAVQRKRGYLFNDGIMLCSWVPNRRGPQRYKCDSFYELGNIGLVVNIKDPECPNYTFKLLIFPNVHLLQCPNQKEKESWVTNIEGLQRILRNPHSTQKSIGSKQVAIESPTTDSLPGFPSIDSELGKSADESLELRASLPDWVSDIPEDLDVWIAQRNFTEAVDLFDSFKEFLDCVPMNSALKELKVKVDGRMRSLVQVLVDDLQNLNAAKVLQGGPRSIRRSVDLLVRLGRENQASQLLLAHRSAYIKQLLKRLKTEGRSQLYLGHLSNVFFQNVAETLKEYGKCFNLSSTSVAGCLVVWVNIEVTQFVNNFCRLLFPQTDLASVSKLVVKLKSNCEMLVGFGIDVSFVVDSTLLVYIQRTLTEAKDKLIEAIRHRHRSQDESGTFTEFSDKIALSKFTNEMSDLGIGDLQRFFKGALTIEISSSTVSFAKSWLHFCDDVMQLSVGEWQNNVETAICGVLIVEIKHLEHAWNKSKKKKDMFEVRLIESDAEFVFDFVVPSAGKMYENVTSHQFPELDIIVEESAFKSKSTTPSPASRTPSSRSTRYTSPEYI